MKKTISFVLTLLVFCSLFTITSCSKKDKVEPQDIDLVSIPDGLVQYNTNTNMVERIRFTVYNHSTKTLYYLKFRAKIYRSDSNTLVWSDEYETGSMSDMSVWTVVPEETKNTEYYPVDFYHTSWYFKAELLDARFIEE